MMSLARGAGACHQDIREKECGVDRLVKVDGVDVVHFVLVKVCAQVGTGVEQHVVLLALRNLDEILYKVLGVAGDVFPAGSTEILYEGSESVMNRLE